MSKKNRSLVRTLLMAPLWVLSLLTPAKSFRDNPVIGSRVLNTLGLHVMRVLLARGLTWLRWLTLAPLMLADERRQFHRDGFLIVPDFLERGAVHALRREIKSHTGDVRQMTQGNTATQRFLLDSRALVGKPSLDEVIKDKRLISRLAYAAATLTPPLLYIQRIRNGSRPGVADPQKTMHADTFHPTMKAWLFLEDVTDEKGPFTYVRGSQRLTLRRLKWEYTRSITARENPDGYSEKGSFRAGPDDLAAMGLSAPKGITVTAGALVIANTNGFHGRGQADDNSSRLELWAYARPSPFNPLPGIPFKAWAALQNRALNVFWRHKDKAAARTGSKASWYLIDAEHMTDFEP